MSGLIPSHDVVVVREGEAEILASGPVTGLLYADSSATGGALSPVWQQALAARL
jgi:hypothetical protein